MRQFALLFTKIDQTQSTNEKVAFIKDYFLEASAEDAAWALFFLSGHRLKRLIGSGKLLLWCAEIVNIPQWLAEEAYSSVGDTAEAVALLFPAKKKGDTNTLSLAEWMEKEILPLKTLSDDEKKARIIGFWHELETQEIFILNKILTGSFRVGISSLLTLKALSQALDIEREILSQRVMGTWEPTPAFFESLKLKEENKRYLNPFPFYLAYALDCPLEQLGDSSEWLVEWKWDGIRCQAVRRDQSCALWSRGNELVTEQFPEIAEALKLVPDGTVLDGEILAFQDGKPLSFGTLQKRLGRKAVSKAMMESVPLVYMLYDILEFHSDDLREKPMSWRRELLESLHFESDKIRVSSKIEFSSWEKISQLRLDARDNAAEGLMLKRLDARYGVGRQKGNWWKYKSDAMTIDAVLIYAQAGSGRRANLFTDYTFAVWHQNELIPVAKAYSGLNQDEIKKLDQWIRKNTEEKFGPVRKVKAFHVFEIAFEGIQISNRHKSGVALRFPRISRWRADKPLEEADTLENIKSTFFHE